MRNEKMIRDAIVSEAIEIPSPEQRAAYIDEACGDDSELKRKVEQGIEKHFHGENPEGTQRAPSSGKHASTQAPKKDGANPDQERESNIQLVGSYKVLNEIGEGPTGIVYQAEQQEPVQLRVALKLIKHGLDWAQVVARFQAERQALLMLDHPNIAKFLGAGTRQSGQPYFVMELVEGLPITTHCDKHQLSLKQRLEMFASVCQAVQCAHQKGIIHGDLKPSNVLVSKHGDKSSPKVLDFGVAKAVRRSLHEGDPSSGLEILGDKPEYLSPEQADPETSDFDTRSDVYSLGVLLYELVTGTTPLTSDRLKDVSITETLRLIREEEPAAPSTRLQESHQRRDALAAKLQMKPEKLVKAVSGDLDCVVKKALAKDRSARYETVSELAHDIQRYLAQEPVEACPHSTRSQLQTVARKYSRLTMVAALLLVFSLALALAGAGLATWAWIDEHQAKKAEQQALQKQEEAQKSEKETKGKYQQAEKAYESTKKERDRARDGERTARNKEQEIKAILDFFKSKLLTAGRPADVSLEEAFWAGSQGRDVTVRKNVSLRMAVDEAESRVASAFADRPMAEATVRVMLGQAYLNLGEASQAVKQYKRAFALREANLGDKHPETAEARNQLAVAYRLDGRTVEASRLFHHLPDAADHADALAERGAALLMQKDPAEAELKLRESLKIRMQSQPENWTTFYTKSLLGEALSEQKKFDEAEPLLLSGYGGLRQSESQIPSQEKFRLTRALKRLVQLYEKWGKPDKTAKWRKELEAMERSKNP
jgi:serine/threonine protein kinase